MLEDLTLSEWVKEAQHRKETIKVYQVNHDTFEVVAVSINPNFIAGIVRTAVLTNYRLTT